MKEEKDIIERDINEDRKIDRFQLEIEIERDINEDRKIDRFQLEIENEEQPTLIYYWSRLLAKEKKRLDDLEIKLKVLIGEKKISYRNNPPKGIKITNDVIDALVDKDKEIIELEYERNDIQYSINILNAAVKTMDNRKSSLKNLTELWVKNYYSYPEVRRSSIDEKQDALRHGLNSKNNNNEE